MINKSDWFNCDRIICGNENDNKTHIKNENFIVQMIEVIFAFLSKAQKTLTI